MKGGADFLEVFQVLFQGERDRVVLEVPNETYIGNSGPKFLAFDIDGVPWDSEGVGDIPNVGKVV